MSRLSLAFVSLYHQKDARVGDEDVYVMTFATPSGKIRYVRIDQNDLLSLAQRAVALLPPYRDDTPEPDSDQLGRALRTIEKAGGKG